MNQQISKKSQSLDLLTVLAFLVVARISCPALSNLPLFSMAFTFVYGVGFLGLFLLTYPRVTKGELGLLLTIALYTVYVVIRSMLSGKGLFATDAFNAYVIVFLTVIYIWSKRQSERKRRQLFGLILLALCFNYIYSIWVLTKDPDASRTAAATSVLEKSPYDVLNAVGSFDTVYGGVSVVAILLVMRRCMDKRDTRKWLLLAVLVLDIVFIYMAAYATALVMLLFTVALILGSRNKVLNGTLVAGFIVILVFHEPVGQWVVEQAAHFSGSETIQEKMLDFGEMLKTFEAAGTYGGEDGRAARMQWSINAFLENPLFGGYGKRGIRVGGHSELLDMLGKYGILGFGLMAAYFLSLYQEIRNGLDDPEMKKCCTIVLFVWIVTAVLNPALYSLQMMPIILMLPLSAAHLNKRKLA